jgi:hypothetical protein
MFAALQAKALILASMTMSQPQAAKGDDSGISSWIPLSPNFVPLKPFNGVYKTLAGVGMAVLVLGGFGAFLLGGGRMAFAGASQQKTEAGARQARTGLIISVVGIIAGAVFIAVAGVASAIH